MPECNYDRIGKRSENIPLSDNKLRRLNHEMVAPSYSPLAWRPDVCFRVATKFAGTSDVKRFAVIRSRADGILTQELLRQ